jgi:hypothetical protein
MRRRLLTDGPVRTCAVVFDPNDEPPLGLVAFIDIDASTAPGGALGGGTNGPNRR